MKKKLFFMLLILPFIAFAQENTTVLPRIIITKLGLFESGDAEWIEIYNRSDAPKNLTGWKFFEDSKNHGLEVFRDATGGTSTEAILQSQEFAIIANKSEIFAQNHPEYAGAIFDSSWGTLKEDGEEIGLKDTEGNFVEIFAYPASTGSSTASLERVDFKISAADPNNWKVFEMPTIGKIRELTSTSLPEPASVSLPDTTSLTVVTPPPSLSLPPYPSSPPSQLSPPSTAPALPLPPLIPQTSSLIPTYIPWPFIQFPSVLEIRGNIVLQSDAKTKLTKEVPKPKPKKSKPKKPKPKGPKNIQPQNGDFSTAIRINEIFPNPGPDDSFGEWIELENRGEAQVNLGNWQIADIEKKSKPYFIPDSITIAPHGFAVLPRADTHIVLNNEYDEVVLMDFLGNVQDRVEYKASKKGNAYALIHLKSKELVASTVALKRRIQSQWNWIDMPTPGEPNPTLENIEGKVSRLIAGGGPGGITSFDLSLPDGKSKTISVAQDVLDSATAETLFVPGTTVSLQALETAQGMEVKRIDEVRPAPTKKDKPSKFLWLGIALIALSVLLNLPPLLRFLREIFKR